MPWLEQTDSHLHGVECKVENLLLYISLFVIPIALPHSLFPRHPFSRVLPHHRISFPAYTLYNLQVPQTVTSPFCSIPSLLFASFSLSRLSLLVSALLIFILTFLYMSRYFLYLLLVVQFPPDLFSTLLTECPETVLPNAILKILLLKLAVVFMSNY